MDTSEPVHPFLKAIVSGKAIHDSPLNQSPAKMQYTFPHANRFASRLANSTLNVPYYNVDCRIHRQTRTTSLGKGNKYDFTKNCKDVPAPNAYFPRNLSISANVTSKRGYSFGVSRELAPQSGIFQASRLGGAKPGPGAYSPALPRSGQTVTFRIKTGKNHSENCNTGPGKYEVGSSFVPSKTIFNSKFRSTKSTKFAPLREIASGKPNLASQPQADLCCDLKHQINTTGRFFNSKYHNSLCRLFGKSQRDVRSRGNELPGPGNYQMPSEFGIYASSKAI